MVKRSLLLCLVAGFITSFSWAQQPLLQKLSATNYLPKETFFLIAGDQPLELLNRLGRESLIQKHQEFYNMMVTELTQAFGQNFLDPAILNSMGADLMGPVGFAFIEMRPENFATFFSVNDMAKMQETILTLADRMGTPVQIEQLAGATLIDLVENRGNKIFFILRGNYLFIFGAGAAYSHPDPVKREMSDEDYAKEQLAIAREFAQIAPENSLASHPRYQKASQSLHFGKDGAMYVDIASIIETTLKNEESYAVSSSETYYKQRILELEEAIKNEPENEESYRQEIGYLEESLRQEKEWIESSKQRRKEEAEIIKSIFGGLHSLMVGAEFSVSSLQVKAFVDIEDQSFLKNIFKNGNGHSLFLNTLKDQPLFLVAGTAKIDTLIEAVNNIFLKRAMGMGGLDQMKEAFKQELGVDLDQELIPLFTGGGGFAVTGKIGMENAEDAFKSIDVAGLLELSDGVKAQEILGRIFSHPELAQFVQKEEGTQTYLIPVPYWKNIYVGVIQNSFVVTSDVEFCGRLSRGESDSFLNRIENAELKSLLQTPNPAALEIIDLATIISVFVQASTSNFEIAKPSTEFAEAHSSSPEEEVPYSDAYNAKKAEIEVAKAEIEKINKNIEEFSEESNKLYQERSESESKMVLQVCSLFDLIPFVMSVESDGIYLHSGLFIKEGTLADSISNIVDWSVEIAQKSDDVSNRLNAVWETQNQFYTEQSELYNKIAQFEQELQEIRARDVEEYYLKKE